MFAKSLDPLEFKGDLGRHLRRAEDHLRRIAKENRLWDWAKYSW